MDDGAKDVGTSLEMLRASYDDGVDNIIATPHYYSNVSVEDFCEKRKHSLEMLGDLSKMDEIPDIYLWAETYYTPQLKYMDLSGLLLNNHLLLELPFEPVSGQALKDIEYFQRSLGYSVVIAHVERYEKTEPLFDMGVGVQVNADSVGKKRIRKLIKSGLVNYIGSDMHDMDKRPPNLVDSLDKINGRFDDEVMEIVRNGNALLA